MLGETADDVSRVSELCCNIDDMTAEEIGFATETILAAGALEVFTVSTGMKKSRPGIFAFFLSQNEFPGFQVHSFFQKMHPDQAKALKVLLSAYHLLHPFHNLNIMFSFVFSPLFQMINSYI